MFIIGIIVEIRSGYMCFFWYLRFFNSILRWSFIWKFIVIIDKIVVFVIVIFFIFDFGFVKIDGIVDWEV